MSAFSDLVARHGAEPGHGVPDVAPVVAPATLDDAAALLAAASAEGRRVLLWGGGTHQGFGYPVDADVVLLTRRLDRIVDWQPDDLTVVVEAGVLVSDLVSRLAERRQTAVLPERSGAGTVGGAVAAGRSGWSRLRYGPLRDRMLESTLVTGDGRVVRAGGRVVKNVTGYDIPRLVTGSFGALGLVGQVCLKLWPRPATERTVTVGSPSDALAAAVRPLAVLETETGTSVYLAGTEREVDAQAGRLGVAAQGLIWPEPIEDPWRLLVRVPPRLTSQAVTRARDWNPVRFIAAHGVGEVDVGLATVDQAAVDEVRRWAEGHGGDVVVARRVDDEVVDPWGTPPPSLPLQRRVKAAFDPGGTVNTGRLPGRL